MCNGDCKNCRLPVTKCRGGGKESATPWRGANHMKVGKGRLPKQVSRVSHRVLTGGFNDVDL